MGLTEASPVITQTTTDDPIELRVTTVGKVLPHTEVKIVNPLRRQDGCRWANKASCALAAITS